MNKYYEVLGISPMASPQEVRDAYRDLVKVWHPDRFSHDVKLRTKAEGKLKEINEAYEKILSGLDSYEQAVYDHSADFSNSDSDNPSPLSPSRGDATQPSRRRSWFLGIIICGLSVLALFAVYSGRRSVTQPIAIATSSPVYDSSPSPTSTLHQFTHSGTDITRAAVTRRG